MGCEIHFHTEVKINNKWEHLGNPEIGRNYELFAFLANVRNDYEEHIIPVSRPRGLPKDISFLTRFVCDSEDGHSHSFLTSADMVKVEKFIEARGKVKGWWPFSSEDLFGHVFGGSWTDVAAYKSKGIQDVRFVFWFDN
eukprot:Filipodium_phascolosomae@DN6493_c0_g1_i1.p1